MNWNPRMDDRRVIYGGRRDTDLKSAQLRSMIRRATVGGIIGLASTVLALGIFVNNASHEREEICDVIKEITLGQTDALIAASTPDSNEERTPEELERRNKAIQDYVGRIDKLLEGC